MKTKQCILLKLVEKDGKVMSLRAVYIRLYLYTQGNFRYCFGFGPTDENGNLRISFDDVERQRIEAGKTSVMDYNTPLADCDDSVRINVPSSKELKDAYDASTSWNQGTPPEFAKPWLTANNAKIKAEDVFVDLKDGEIAVHVTCRL